MPWWHSLKHHEFHHVSKIFSSFLYVVGFDQSAKDQSQENSEILPAWFAFRMPLAEETIAGRLHLNIVVSIRIVSLQISPISPCRCYSRLMTYGGMPNKAGHHIDNKLDTEEQNRMMTQEELVRSLVSKLA